jgi:haloalkane dehalogenase
MLDLHLGFERRHRRLTWAFVLLLGLFLGPGVAIAQTPSAELRYTKKKVATLGHEMAYIDAGAGRPIVFLHGNPTSSYLWRNVIPHVEPHARCIAPDLIGMGDSDKLPPTREDGDDGRYKFVEQRRYLDAFLDEVVPDEPIVLVIHDWGSALGFDWARRHPNRVAGIVYMDSLLLTPDWDNASMMGGMIFDVLRSGLGEWLILEHNAFVEYMLPSMVARTLTSEELANYRAPFLEPGEDRRPTLTWPREVPIDGEPSDVDQIINDYLEWLPGTVGIPKLWVDVSDGAVLSGNRRDFAASLPNQKSVRVEGRHFVQEDSPDEIGQAIAEWLQGLSPPERR